MRIKGRGLAERRTSRDEESAREEFSWNWTESSPGCGLRVRLNFICDASLNDTSVENKWIQDWRGLWGAGQKNDHWRGLTTLGAQACLCPEAGSESRDRSCGTISSSPPGFCAAIQLRRSLVEIPEQGGTQPTFNVELGAIIPISTRLLTSPFQPHRVSREWCGGK